MKISAVRNVGLAILALGATAAATTVPASARDGAVAAGVLGGLAAGAIVGSAAANAGGGYGYAPAYAPPPPPPVYDTGCYFTRQATYDPYGNFAGYRRVRVCE
jgi:Ca2+/Na+ antiporter